MLPHLLSLLHSSLLSLNTNKFFAGIVMLILNLGSKYVDIELPDEHKEFLSNNITRRVVIFTIVFMATRDIITSLIVTCLFIILIFNLLNKKSKYCLLPSSFKKLDENQDGVIDNNEIKKAYEILQKHGKFN